MFGIVMLKLVENGVISEGAAKGWVERRRREEEGGGEEGGVLRLFRQPYTKQFVEWLEEEESSSEEEEEED